MPRPEKAYKSVIIAIHARRRMSFAIWEIAYDTGFSRQTASRVIDRLLMQGWLQRDKRVHFNNRIYRTRKKWPAHACREVIDYYEVYQLAAGDHQIDITSEK